MGCPVLQLICWRHKWDRQIRTTLNPSHLNTLQYVHIRAEFLPGIFHPWNAPATVVQGDGLAYRRLCDHWRNVGSEDGHRARPNLGVWWELSSHWLDPDVVVGNCAVDIWHPSTHATGHHDSQIVDGPFSSYLELFWGFQDPLHAPNQFPSNLWI